MSIHLGRVLVRIAAVLLALFSLTCEESLPPFQDPSNTVKAGVLRTRYRLVVDDNSMEITLTVRHQYDETLEGITNLDGAVTITSARIPSVSRILSFNYTSLTTPQKYNASTHTLRFDPGDTLVFKIRWDFTDNKGDSLKNTFFRYNADPNCPYRCIADEEVFVIAANLRLFDTVPTTVYEPERFSVCHVSKWIDGAFCDPIITAYPCSYFPAVRLSCDLTSQ